MKVVKKYISCRTEYLLRLYIFMVLFTCLLVFIKSCPSNPFNAMIGPALLGPTIMFVIISPVFGLTFTSNSINSCRFHLPYKYIKNIQVDEYGRKITISYNYYACLGIKTKKEYKYRIHIDNYETTIPELLKCFPEDIPLIYD